MAMMSRRKWAGVTLSALTVPRLGNAGTRILSREPLITEQDFAQFPETITPAADFYVRNHFGIPGVDMATWTLRCEGLLVSPKAFDLATLQKFPQTEMASLLECAGNGAGMGGVGCARWKGVRLAEVLAACKILPRARWVRMTGMDAGTEPDSGGTVSYARSISVERALSPATILAFNMNGETLKPEHGAPCRVLVAGHYGMDSVKWLRAIELIEQPDESLYMARRFRRLAGDAIGAPVSTVRVKSILAKPGFNSVVRGSAVDAGGYAWTGAGRIARVEVRLDALPWRRAQLPEAPREFVWTRWNARFTDIPPGVHSLAVRAVSDSGEEQPETRDARRQDQYELNATVRAKFFLRP